VSDPLQMMYNRPRLAKLEEVVSAHLKPQQAAALSTKKKSKTGLFGSIIKDKRK
jgi:hypothetical protein